ncbi:hypothetical protein FOVG_16357 [Fusarium oxysporum f. sp. pisi HDV247]|uniref:Uncharacterized protein n=1 Tax=Fusarium oxysporum f. sp. pisi HDV247 TaxID=1080344 RepID=W9NNY3_FUSOX|nr:hypothetical protein FOVG_16357 [Fusarium oxysporum f. sp. pisi HDV247]
MSTRINGERRTPFPPSGTCPTRSQPYGSFKHIILKKRKSSISG